MAVIKNMEKKVLYSLRKPILSRKAQIETQFNWLFILVAGAVILIFFAGIVIKQKSSSEQKIAENVMTDLQSIFTGGSVSTGTLMVFPRI